MRWLGIGRWGLYQMSHPAFAKKIDNLGIFPGISVAVDARCVHRINHIMYF